MRKHASVFAVLALILAVVPIGAQAPAVSQSDLAAIHQIREEGFGATTSKVMEIISYLSDIHGPRLTNSPNIKEAAKWTTDTMNEWKLANVHLEPWGPFGRGWSNERTNVQVITPHPFPLIAYAKAWTPGTNGPVTADAVFAPITKEEDFAKFKGQLKGKFVLTAAIPESPERFDPQAHRYTDAELADLATQPVPASQAGQEERIAQFRATREFQLKVQKFLSDEGVAAWIEPSRSDDGTVFVQQGGGRDKEKDPPAPCRVAVANENYGRIVRTLEKKVPVTMLVDIENKFYDDDLNSFNIIGEIPGSDKAKADEIVMLGGHFDSWQSGTGATDNGAGSAVMLEAMRILKATGVKMRRTVRIGLWTGEEQGLFGSRAYMKQHFGDPNVEQDRHHSPDQDHARARQARRLLQHRQRHRQNPRRLSPRKRNGRSNFQRMDGSVPRSRHDHADHPQHRRHGSPFLRRRRPPGLSIHPGSDGLRHSHPPLQHGRLRTHPGSRHETNGRNRRQLRLPDRQPRRNAPAQTATQGATRSPIPVIRHSHKLRAVFSNTERGQTIVCPLGNP